MIKKLEKKRKKNKTKNNNSNNNNTQNKDINEEEKKAVYREKIKSYMDRAETVKRMVDEMKEGD